MFLKKFPILKFEILNPFNIMINPIEFENSGVVILVLKFSTGTKVRELGVELESIIHFINAWNGYYYYFYLFYIRKKSFKKPISIPVLSSSHQVQLLVAVLVAGDVLISMDLCGQRAKLDLHGTH